MARKDILVILVLRVKMVPMVKTDLQVLQVPVVFLVRGDTLDLLALLDPEAAMAVLVLLVLLGLPVPQVLLDSLAPLVPRVM